MKFPQPDDIEYPAQFFADLWFRNHGRSLSGSWVLGVAGQDQANGIRRGEFIHVNKITSGIGAAHGVVAAAIKEKWKRLLDSRRIENVSN